MADYSGLTRNLWTGTWSPNGNHPIVLESEIRGSLQYISGQVGEQLTDIPGQRIQEGMLVYVKDGYGMVTGDRYYTYKLLSGESRDVSTGAVPNAANNWSEVNFSGGNVSVSASVETSDTAPASPSVGDLWWDTTQGQLYIFYDDYWIQASESVPQLPDTFSGDYNDLSNKPTLANVATSGSYTDLSNTPTLANVATSGSYTDLSNTPTLANVATSGSYNDLTDTPTIIDDLTDLGIADGTNGQVLTTDGNGGFSFADASGGGSGITAWMVLQSDYALTVNPSFNVHQKIFDVGANGNGAFNLEAGVYRYTAQLYFTNMATGSETFEFGGTATISSMIRLINSRKQSALFTTTNFSQQTVQLGGLSQTASPNTSGTNVWLELEGIIDVSSAGTVIPKIRLGGTTNPSSTVKQGSFFTITRIGDTGATYGGDVD